MMVKSSLELLLVSSLSAAVRFISCIFKFNSKVLNLLFSFSVYRFHVECFDLSKTTLMRCKAGILFAFFYILCRRKGCLVRIGQTAILQYVTKYAKNRIEGIVLSIKDKLNYLEQPVPFAPVVPAGQHVALEILATHTAWIKRSKEIDGLMLMIMEPDIQRNLETLHAHEMLLELKTLFAQQNYNMHSMGKTINGLHAMLKLHEQTLPKNNALALHAIRAASGAGGSGIFVIELNTILNTSWIYDTGCGTHIYNTTQGLRAGRKLKPGALSLYVGNGQREAVEAIGVFYLYLPSGLEIVLNNFHYASSITRGVISVSRLYKDGFINHFVNNKIQVFRNNMVYFSAIPRDAPWCRFVVGVSEEEHGESFWSGGGE
nr:hypothetical protein [Tanacetum cinerariifolium]